jgi:hypothetical protein
MLPLHHFLCCPSLHRSAITQPVQAVLTHFSLLQTLVEKHTMARTMPAPWVFNIITELLKDPTQEPLDSEPCCRPRVVQVLKVHQDENIIIINDKKHSIAVFLSQQCVESFVKCSNQNISSLENSMIKLEKWHFSTTVQCLGVQLALFG